MKNVFRRPAAAAAAFALAMLGAPLLAPPPAAAAPMSKGNRVVVVYDSSYSMVAKTTKDQPKHEVAAQAFASLLETLRGERPNLSAGLVLFGHRQRVSDRVGAEIEGCRDVEIAARDVPLDGNGVQSLRGQVGAVRPTGYTPMSLALTQAATALGQEGGTVFVITDYEDFCEPDKQSPCEAFRQINAQRPPSQRVFVSAIIVPRSRGMKMDGVHELAACTGATPVELHTIGEARELVAATVREIVTQSAPRPQPAPRPQSPAAAEPPTLRVYALRPADGVIIRDPDYTTEVRVGSTGQLATDGPLPMPAGPITLEPGVYNVAVRHKEKLVAEQPDVRLHAGDTKEIYFVQ